MAKRPKLTRSLQAKYLKAKGMRCPFCNSKNLDADKLDADGPEATANVICNDCSEEWVDIYTLTGVEQAEELTSDDNDNDDGAEED
jgi:transcription elongation factor Elf1